VAALLAWRERRELTALEQIRFIRTDEAQKALLRLRGDVPDESMHIYETLVENAGVFPDTREPSVYPRTLMGLVGDRQVSRHHMGAGYGPLVPICPLCERPGVRVLTLARDTLPFKVAGRPIRRYSGCPATATPSSTSMSGSPIKASKVSSLRSGRRMTTRIGCPITSRSSCSTTRTNTAVRRTPSLAVEHQVGGYPPWVQTDRFPRCAECGQGMRYLASVDSGRQRSAGCHSRACSSASGATTTASQLPSSRAFEPNARRQVNLGRYASPDAEEAFARITAA